jgi:dolichol-phosphate mannosyltransferase
LRSKKLSGLVLLLMSISANLLSNPSGALHIPLVIDSQVQLSLILPTYQEGQNIAQVVELLASKLDGILPGAYELIVVDDNSPDLTWEIAAALTPQYPQLQVIRRTTERGLATAVVRGWQASQGRVLGVIDADLQHPPEVLAQLWQALHDQNADLAVASRNVEGGGVSEWSLLRRCLSRGAQVLGLVLLPEVIGRISDPMSGYFLLRREAIAGRVLSPLGYKILIEAVGRGNVGKIAEVGYEFQERQSGESKVTARQYVEYIQHLLRLRLARSGRFLRFIAVGLSGLAIDMLILYLLTDASTLNLPLTRSAIVAGEIAIINNFFWNDRWTFRDLASQQTGRRQMMRRFLKFNLVCLMGLVLKALILNLLFNFVFHNQYISNFLAIICVTLWNFWINLKLSWRVTDRKN